MSISRAKEIVLSFLTDLEGKISKDDHQLVTKLKNSIQKEGNKYESFRLKNVKCLMKSKNTFTEKTNQGPS